MTVRETTRDPGPAAGLLLVSADGVRVAEWRPRRADDVLRLEFPPLRDGRELRGPAHAHPRHAAESAPAARSSSQRDLLERRLARHRREFVRDAAVEVAEIARARGWRAVVVLGDPRLAHVAARVLHDEGVKVAESRRVMSWLPPPALAERVRPEVEAALAAR